MIVPLPSDAPAPWDERTVAALNTALRQAIEKCATLEQAAQRFTTLVRSELGDTVVLARVYLTLPSYRLPVREQRFASQVAAAEGRVLADDTKVLTLLGTSGKLPEWNDRRTSKGHVAIPLLDSRFVAKAPMVATMLREFGVQLDWLDAPHDIYIRKLMGGLNGLFFVADAREARTSTGELVIPATDFVATHRIRSVFGVGGVYLNGWILTAILFTRSRLKAVDLSPFTALAATMKISTTAMVARGSIFAAEDGPP